MSKLPQKLDLPMMQTQWSQILSPLLSNPYLKGNVIQAKIVSGTNVINHKLGRVQQGWTQTDIDQAVSLYRSEPFNASTLTLVASGPCNVSLYVF